MDMGDLYSIVHHMELKTVEMKDNELHQVRSGLILKIQKDFNVKIKLALKMAQCISQVHEKSPYAHLDVKSLNFLVDNQLEVKITDFCDAKMVDKSQLHDLTPFQPHGTIYWW